MYGTHSIHGSSAPSVSNNLLSSLYAEVCGMGRISIYTNKASLNNIIITCYWHLTSDIPDLYLWDLWHNTLSCSPLIYDICATVLNHLTCLFSSFHTVSLFCYCEGSSDYINSAYGDLRYMVYIWGFPCLDYSLDVSISWIQSLGLYNGCGQCI